MNKCVRNSTITRIGLEEVMRHIFLFLFMLVTFTSADLMPLEDLRFYTSDSDSVVYNGGILPIDSAGTYRMVTSFSGVDSGSYLFVAPSPHALTIRLNGHQIYEWGSENSLHCLANYDAETIALPDEFLTDTNQLVITLVSDGTRVAFPSMMIGSFDEVSVKSFWISLLNHDFIIVIVGVAVFSFLLLAFYIYLVRFKDESLLFLALFCLALVAEYAMFVFNHYTFDQVLFFKIARIGGVMMSLTLFLFITSMTGFLKKYTYRLIVSAAFVPYVMLILNGASKFEVNVVFNAASHTLIFPLFIVGLILMILSMGKSQRVEVVCMLVPYLVLMGTVFSDLNYLILFRQPAFWKIPYGYLVMIAGGIFAVLFKRTRQTRMYFLDSDRLKAEITALKDFREDEQKIQHRFLSEFSVTSKHAETSFSKLFSMVSSEENSSELKLLYSTFINFHLNSLNMIFLDKIQQDELYLWFDGFSLTNILEKKISTFSWIAEEKGVELRLVAKKHTFPPLVWGDKQAVFLVLSNIIISAVEVEATLLRVELRYIPYEGLEVTVQGTEEDFARELRDLLSTTKLHNETYPIAVVFKDIAARLDCDLEIVAVNKSIDIIRFVVPLKLSEN